MRGTAYGVGVGSGDPENMTLKALRLIRDNNIIAFASAVPEESPAYKIAVQNVPEISKKQLISVYMPMTTDKQIMEQYHQRGIALIESFLDKGENVVFLTIGDPAIYCSFGYLRRKLVRDGYKAEFVSGIPSFCAAAAKTGITLSEGKKCIHVIPALSDSITSIDIKKDLDTYVFMKSGKTAKSIIRRQ